MLLDYTPLLTVHYHKDTGEITCWGTGESEESHLLDHFVARFDIDLQGINPGTHKIEPSSGLLVEKTPAQKADWIMPILGEVETAVRNELLATDGMIVPDRPMDEDVRTKWKVYRQALRDLSKGKVTPESMITNWPERPDELDVTKNLRDRLEQAKELRGSA